MKKLIFILLSVLLLASCAKGIQNPNENISPSPGETATAQATQTAVTPTVSIPSPNPSPTVSETSSLPITSFKAPIPLSTSISYSNDEKVSKTIDIGKVKTLMKTPPQELFSTLGDDVNILGYVDDIDAYVVACNSLDIAIHYSCEFENRKDPVVEIPKLPVKVILIHNFEFRGLNEESTFKDVISIFGETEVRTGYEEDYEYYYLRYTIAGMLFEFYGSDKQGSDGVNLNIRPD